MRLITIFLFGISTLSIGCGGSSVIGRLNLDNSDETIISTRISFTSYPSRWVYFRPSKQGDEKMLAYKESVYSSNVIITVTNNGKSTVCLELYDKEMRIENGQSETFEALPFKDIRLLIAPEGGGDANLEFKLKFDQAYTTSSWKLLAVWSDGP